MTRNSGFKKRKKRQSDTPVKGPDTDSDGAIGDHPDTNAINRSLSSLYMAGKGFNTPRKDISIREEQEEEAADKEIEKALKKKQRVKERYIYEPSATSTFDTIGGMDQIIEDIKRYLDPEKNKLVELGERIWKRILISGVSGVGKSKLADGIINHFKLNPVRCTLSRLSGNPPEVASACRNLFSYVSSLENGVILMDELDLIVGRPADSKSDNTLDIRIEALIESFEELNKNNPDITIIGLTSSVDALNYRFMNIAEFSKKIHIDVPNDKTREAILRVLCKDKKISSGVQFDELGFKTPGYVGADLRILVKEACTLANERLTAGAPGHSECQDASMEDDSNSNITLTRSDFLEALKMIKPSLKKDGFASIPTTTWADIGACDHIRKDLMAMILLPVKFPSFMQETLRGKPPSGILLHGPPGCGKTSIAKAIANESEISFISIKGPEVLNKYVGESEARIREIFDKAEKAKPCVIFFDEIECLCADRSDSDQSNVAKNVLTQMLTMMDGFDNQSCLVLAATNRPDILDKAILRPGRFDTHIFVGVPDAPARYEILRAVTRQNVPPLAPDVCLKSLAFDDRLRNFTGADLNGLISLAHNIACTEMFHSTGTLNKDQFVIRIEHIEAALKKRVPSISDNMLKSYLESAKNFGLNYS